MNWLITGGCGFIGTNLVRCLLAEGGHYIRIVDNLQSGSREKLRKVCDFIEPERIIAKADKVHFFPYNIKNEDFAMKVCRGIDVVVHLAANTGVPVSVEFPRDDCMTNVVGTLNYLEAARHNKVKRFIFASSSAVPGDHEPPYHETLFTRPVSPYGASKGAGESYCHVYNATYGVETIALRFSNVYGPLSENKEAQLIPKFIMAALAGRTLEIYGDGSQTRDFCYVDDLIDAIKLSVVTPNIGGHVFQIATNCETNVQKITDIITTILYDHVISVVYSNERLGDVQRNFSDVSKANKLLGWKNRVNIEEGIKRTIEWFMKEVK